MDIIFDFHHVNLKTLIKQKQAKVKVLEDRKESEGTLKTTEGVCFTKEMVVIL